MKKLRLLIKVSRPVFWLLGPLAFLAGLAYSGGSLNSIGIIQLFLLSFPLSLFCFGINDIHDYRSDRLNPRKGMLQGSILKKKYHVAVFQYALIMEIILFMSSILTFNASNILSMLLLLFFTYAYSAPPFRLKEIPVIDSLANAVIALSAFMIGFSYGMPLNHIDSTIMLTAFVVSGIHAFTTAVDYKSDKKAKIKTFAAALGKRSAVIYASFTTICALVFGNFSLLFQVFFGLCLSLFILAIATPKNMRLYSVVLYICAIITGILQGLRNF